MFATRASFVQRAVCSTDIGFFVAILIRPFSREKPRGRMKGILKSLICNLKGRRMLRADVLWP